MRHELTFYSSESFDGGRDFISYLRQTVLAKRMLTKLGIYEWHLKKLLVEKAGQYAISVIKVSMPCPCSLVARPLGHHVQ